MHGGWRKKASNVVQRVPSPENIHRGGDIMGDSLMMKKIIFAVFFFSVVSFSYAGEQRYTVPLDDSPFCGASTASLTIIEFLDYQ